MPSVEDTVPLDGIGDSNAPFRGDIAAAAISVPAAQPNTREVRIRAAVETISPSDVQTCIADLTSSLLIAQSVSKITVIR
jgi:hypothetical protein